MDYPYICSARVALSNHVPFEFLSGVERLGYFLMVCSAHREHRPPFKRIGAHGGDIIENHRKDKLRERLSKSD